MATNQSLDIGGTDLTARLIGIGMVFTGKGCTGTRPLKVRLPMQRSPGWMAVTSCP